MVLTGNCQAKDWLKKKEPQKLFIFGCAGSSLLFQRKPVAPGFSLVAASGSTLQQQCDGFSLQCLLLRSMGYKAQAQLPRGMWNCPRPGIRPMSPALAGNFLTTEPPGKSKICFVDATVFTVHFGAFILNICKTQMFCICNIIYVLFMNTSLNFNNYPFVACFI